jgi:hypothetical protein
MPLLDLEELKRLHEKAYNANDATRERAANDLVFYWLTQWDDDVLSESQLAYRGEFNILRKAGRQILSDLEMNPVQVNFEPKDLERRDSAEILDGLYRSDDNNNSSIEAFEVSKQEAVVCGAGAWILYPEYESLQKNDNKQVIRRKAVNEANNVVFWDPNSVRLDKSDAKYVSILTPYSKDAYKDLVYELTGEKIEEVDTESFKQPDQSFTFPWITGSADRIYVTEFYHRQKVKATKLTLTDPFGTESEIWEDDLADQEDELLDGGFSITGAKKFERWRVTKYIASGEGILSSNEIAGSYIPVIPVFGEHAIVEGEEHWEGISRLAKDPQRLRNFILSYIAEIASRSPRPKAIFFPEQIQGHEDMYQLSGADNNYPYYLQNRKSIDGEDLPIGPVAVMPEQTIPSPLVALAQLTREAVEDVANPGTPQDVADPDISGRAVLALQARLDMQSVVYQTHYKHAKRWDAVVYASMASEIYDVPRKVRLTMADGTKKDDQVMEQTMNPETGDIETKKDLRNVEFEVFSKIGPGYTTQKEQTIDKLTQMVTNLDPGDPVRKVLQLKILQLMDGVDFDDIRDYVKKQLILMGIRKPETPEEEEFAKQAAEEAKQPDPNMLLAMAEMEKAKADQMQANTKMGEVQVDAQNEGMKRQIEQFQAMTDRLEAMIKAQVAGADIKKKEKETAGQELENAAQIIELNPNLAEMSDDDLYKQAMIG